MTSRLLAAFGLAALMAGLAHAQDKPSVKAQVKEAIEAANDDIPKAISIIEKALKEAPDDREAVYLLGAMTAVQGESATDKAERIALFHKSTAAFAKLQKLFKDLTPYEKMFKARSQVGEARALALEGKTRESLAAIKSAMAEGFNRVKVIESEDDLESVRKLPEFKTLMAENYKAQLAQAKKEVAEELPQAKSFPFDFELKDIEEKTVSLADYKGKVTIVDVWGTWCPPCRNEIPHFVDLYKEYKDKGLEIVGINCNEQGSRDEIKKTIKAFAKEYKIDYKCLLNDDKTESKIPDFQGYPTTLFLDRSGKVRLSVIGEQPKAKLEAIIAALLADSAKPAEAKAN